MASLTSLLKKVRACRECEAHLPHGPRPILTATESATVLIAGQAPGRRVHESGIPWDDISGDRLRTWLGISRDVFYDDRKIALLPMGFCYPGTGKSGDLPPRKECRELWHESLLARLTNIKLTLLVGQYAQAYHLAEQRQKSLTDTVRAWRQYAPHYYPIPHPSPRNQAWLKNNSWFEKELLPVLKEKVRVALA